MRFAPPAAATSIQAAMSTIASSIRSNQEPVSTRVPARVRNTVARPFPRLLPAKTVSPPAASARPMRTWVGRNTLLVIPCVYTTARWVERARPRAMDDVERALGVRPREKRPHDVVEVGHVHVVVHHDHDAAEVGAHAAHRGHVGSLTRVPRVALLDRDREEEAAAPDAEAVGVDDARDAGRLELAEEERASQIFAVAVRLIRRLVRRDAEDDRVVAVV